MNMKGITLMRSIIMIALTILTPASFAYLQHVKIETGYQDQNGNLIIRIGYNKELSKIFSSRFFYGNQEGLYNLKVRIVAGSGIRYMFSFLDRSQENQTGVFFAGVDPEDFYKETDQYTLVCDGKQLNFEPISENIKKDIEQKIRNDEISLIPLPNERQPVYLFGYKDGDTIIYVDGPKFFRNTYDFRLFIGKMGEMKELKVTDEQRFRDGGTTYIYLEDGSVLFAPARRDNIPTWTDSSGQEIELKEYSIHSDLTLLGINGVPTSEKALKTPCELLND